MNQLYVDADGQVHGLENADMALWRTMIDLVNEFETSSSTNTTYGAFYHFRRPIPATRTLAAELTAALGNFLSGDRDLAWRPTLPCGIRLTFFDWKTWKGSPFKLAGSMDAQSGGHVVANVANSIRYALLDKDSKVEGYRSKYPQWWLILVDFVSWGTDENDRRQLRATGPFAHSFDRVYVVNPRNIADHFEL